MSYNDRMGEPACEMPVSQVREHFADVVNSAAYGRRITVITRRGKRIAEVVPPHWVEAAEAEAREAAAAKVCREWWRSVADADQATQDAVRVMIDRILEAAEDATDIAASNAVQAGIDAGAPTYPAEQVWAELGLDMDDDE